MSQNANLPVQRTVVLGSTSRYRRELLSRLNLPFEVAAPDVDETHRPANPPAIWPCASRWPKPAPWLSAFRRRW